MRKLFLVLVSILLLAGVAEASEWTSTLNAEMSAQNTGRVVVTDSSVILQVYYKGTGLNPSIGVSNDTVILTDDGVADVSVDTTAAATNTIGEIVDIINADGDWVAIVGPDGYRDYPVSGAILAYATGKGATEYIGNTLEAAGSFYGDSSTAWNITCGVKADNTARIRVKNVSQNWASAYATMSIAVYDGNTKIWQKNIPSGSTVSTTHPANSANTVIVAGEKGLASTKGNSLCVVVSTDSLRVEKDMEARGFNLSIAYDKLRD